MSYPAAQLCELCKQVFESHWVSKESIQLKNQDDTAECTEDTNSDYSEEEISASCATDTSNSGFYEAPDWVTVVSAANSTLQASQDYQSPSHHSVTGLERSANNGCYLCTIFWDLVL